MPYFRQLGFRSDELVFCQTGSSFFGKTLWDILYTRFVQKKAVCLELGVPFAMSLLKEVEELHAGTDFSHFDWKISHFLFSFDVNS
jgi:hypothetical protein